MAAVNQVDQIDAKHVSALKEINRVLARPYCGEPFSFPAEKLAAIWDILDRTAVFRRVLTEDGHSVVDVMEIMVRHTLHGPERSE